MDSTQFIIIIASLMFSAFFSGMEIAFVSSNKLKIELDKKLGNFSAGILARFNRQPAKFIAAMLLGNNIALVIFGITMAAVLEPGIKKYVSSEATILAIQTIISTFIILITAEFLPKAVFRINPNRTLNLFAVPAFIVYYFLYFIVKFIIGLSNLFLKTFFKVEISDDKPVFGRVDLDDYVKEATSMAENSQEDLDHEIQIFQNALDFSEVKARECMIPRTEIVAMETNDPIAELQEKFIDTGLSKIMIYSETIDNIIGYTHSYELFKRPDNIRKILLPVSIVPESMPANELLELFIKKRQSIAVVVDEFGGTSGIITVEDIVEEIVGEIEDEHDQEKLVERVVNERTFEFSARLEIDYLNEKYKLGIPGSNDYETLAGFIISNFESIPEVNQLINIDSFTFEILEVSDKHIELVRLKLLEEKV